MFRMSDLNWNYKQKQPDVFQIRALTKMGTFFKLFYSCVTVYCYCLKKCCNHIFILPRLKNHPCYYKTFKYIPKTKPIEKAPELVHELLVIIIISLAQNVHIIKTNPYCSNVYPVLMFIYNKLPFIGP